jgi:hypothetical protein
MLHSGQLTALSGGVDEFEGFMEEIIHKLLKGKGLPN